MGSAPTRLIFIGLATQFIYVVYIVAFPLISNTLAGGPAADLEILMRANHWFAAVYFLGILLLYYLFWQAMRTVSTITHHLPQVKMVVLAFGLTFGFTLIWLYPITAIDLFGYVVRGRVWAVHGESPMLSPPNKFTNDPYLAFAGEFGNLVSVYGPLWELIVQIPLRLGATEMVPAVISLKLIILLFFLGCAVLIGWFACFDPAIRPSNPSLAGLTFFAWNPLILMQGLGNGHNDMVFLALMVLGIVLWQRKAWWIAGIALALAVAVKITALLMVPLFAVVLLRSAWASRTMRPRQILKAGTVLLLSLLTVYLLYIMLGPISKVFKGLLEELLTRRGFSIASNLRVILYEIIPRSAAEYLPRTTARYIFIAFYAWLLFQLWRSKLNLVTAGFLAYFSQIILNPTFRIWYPTWLVPLAALQLTPALFWPTLLFGLTSELSIINYFVVWRWWLRNLSWGKEGPLHQYWNYWTIMYSLTVPWLFGIPLFGPMLIKWWQQKKRRGK